jgi:hypothetical protein
MRIAFSTAVGVLVGLLTVACMMCEPMQNSVLLPFLQLMNLPGLLLCLPFKAIGILPNTGGSVDFLDWMLLGALLQWTLVGVVWGIIGRMKARKQNT